MMKRILIFTFALFISLSLSAQDNTIRLTVSGEGATKEEATANALRSAIEQAFGTFVSANTQILNDDIVKDEIATISSGNIQEYTELGCITMPDGSKSVSLSATVSIGNLISYAKSKGSSAEFAGALFAMNMKMKRLNKDNEAKALSHLITRLDKIVENYGLFDVSIAVDSNPYKTLCYNQATKSESEYYGVYLTLNYAATNNSKLFFDLLISTIRSLALTDHEIKEYVSSNEDIYKISIANNCHRGGYSVDNYTTDRAEFFYLRNRPEQFIEGLVSIMNKSLYDSVLLKIHGLDAQYKIDAPIGYDYNIIVSRNQNNIRYLIDNRDYKAARDTHWKELYITKNTPKNSVATIPILTYAQIPDIFLFPQWTSYSLYDAESNSYIKSLSSLDLEGVDFRKQRENSFALCLDNIFNFSQNGQMLYQIRFDLPLTENELGRVTNFSIISNNNSSIDNNIVDSKSNIIYPTIDIEETREKVTTEIPKTPQTPQASIPEGEPVPYQLVEENPSNQNPNNNQSSSKVYSKAYDGYINIRDSSTSKGTIIGKFKNGPDGAICLSQTGEWTKINYKGVTGYVYTKYLSDSPTEDVTLSIDGNWLKGIWRNAEEQYAYLIFNNGTFALQSASGTLAYGTYMLKGNDIEFNIKQLLSSMDISKIKRFRIDSSSDEIGPLRKQSFLNNTEMYGNSGGLTWTESQYLALRNEIRKLLETGVSAAKTESFTRTDDVQTERTETLDSATIKPIPFQIVEEKPSFQGGDINQFLNWVRENQIYPEIAKENGIQGRVTVRATINTDGSLTDIMVVRGVDPSLDKEAIRVVSLSPKWKPGKQGGKAVPVTYNFPITFQIR